MAIAHPSLSIHDDDSAPLQRQDLLQAIVVVNSTVSISEHRKGHVQLCGEMLRFCSTPAANEAYAMRNELSFSNEEAPDRSLLHPWLRH